MSLRIIPVTLSLLLLALFYSCSGDDDGTPSASAPNEGVPSIAWKSQINGLQGMDVEINHDGELFVVGDYTGNPGVDGLQSVSVGLRNGFLIQYDQAGVIEHTMNLGLQVFHDLNYMDFLPNGNPVVSGKDVDFQNVMYLELHPSSNTQVSANSIQGSGNDKPAGIAIDNDGNIILGGIYNGTVQLLTGETYLGNILGSAAVVKFSPAGELLWLFPSPIATSSGLRGVDVDNDGNVFCYECANDLIYLRKLSPQGELIYTKEDLGACGYGLEVVSSSEIYLNTVSDVLRLDEDGNIKWTFETSTQLLDIAVGNEEIVVAGHNFSGGNFGTIEGLVRTDNFLGALTTSGKAKWVSTETTASRVSINASGKIGFGNPALGTLGVLE